MPPHSRNQRVPTAGDTPAATAASSLDRPRATSSQNLCRCSRRPTGGRPGATESCRTVRRDRRAGLDPQVVRHMRALPHGEVASAIEKVRASKSGPVVKLAFEFLVLTATRSGEVRGAVWTEIDRDEGVWTIPAPRTKGNREHRVPLSRRALEILEEARALGRGSLLVFPSVRGNPLGVTALSRLLKTLRIAAVPHGFRSSFRDWAAEETDYPRKVAEAALAHTVRNPIGAAYRRTDLFERRRRLIDDWAAYLAHAGYRVITEAGQLPDAGL